VAVPANGEQYFDAAGRFIHPCCRCGKPAMLGFGVSLRTGKLGTWYCGGCAPAHHRAGTAMQICKQKEATMGIDVIGRKPTSKEGEYFRNNVWWWRPLADYCMEIALDIAARCEGWHYNDGDGLNDRDSAALADALQREIDSGGCRRYAEIRKSVLEQLPNEPCDVREATGIRKAPPKYEPSPGDEFPFAGPEWERGAGDPANGVKCPSCNSEGYVRPWRSHYDFEVENVQAFVTFLRGSDGFAIW
jgi:hypothetical protein